MVDNKDYADDGRRSIGELHKLYDRLVSQYNWKKEKIYRLGIYAVYVYTTRIKGNSIMLTSGIHGEEPAGPNALAESVDYLGELGKNFPIVLRPLCNPLGYAKNTRYYNRTNNWKMGKSVGDAEHLLPAINQSSKPRKSRPTSIYTNALLNNVLSKSQDYPPILSFDLHEDVDPNVTTNEFYLYSHGKLGIKDPIAYKVFKALKSTNLPYLKKGKTRFGEKVINGMIGQVQDGSLDEFVASEKMIVKGKLQDGLHCSTVIVIETPTDIPLKTRISAQKKVITSLEKYLASSNFTNTEDF